MMTKLRERFFELHNNGLFVMPNAWDVGSARVLAALHFPAVATTSSGLAASLGRGDQQVSRDELLAHVAAVVAAIDVPLSVDAERCFAEDPQGVAETVRMIGGVGAAGCSIEDYNPATRAIEQVHAAAERVAAAAGAARESGMVLTARADNHLYTSGDLDDTITRLQAYRAAGADVLYAPGLTDSSDITRVVREVDAPVNVLALPHGPTVSEMAGLGVSRVSTGGALAKAAYRALVSAARELIDDGTATYAAPSPVDTDLAAALETS